jgi:protein OS-9
MAAETPSPSCFPRVAKYIAAVLLVLVQCITSPSADVNASADYRLPCPVLTHLPLIAAGRCLYHNDGQWTYEVCYKRSVRQFRQEAHGEGIEEFTCGRYKGDEQQEEAVLVS